jgi:thiol-disulfide isomerase/thioredoxin
MNVMLVLAPRDYRRSRIAARFAALSVMAGTACSDVPDVPGAGSPPETPPSVAIEPGSPGPPPERPLLPSISLETFDGDTASFSDYRGKALLVNVWASWCGPCREELPRLKEYYGMLDRDRVEFLAISDDRDEDAARRFADPMDLPFPLFLGGGEAQRSFRYFGLPYTLIVDGRGRIVKEIYGFGSDASWHGLTRALEREMERVSPGDPVAEPTSPDRGAKDVGRLHPE